MQPTATQSSEQSSIVAGSTLLTAAMLVASALNYLINVGLTRLLDPAAFGDAFVVVTSMLLLTAIAVTVQLATAKVVADADDASAVHASMRDRVSRLGWSATAAVLLLAVVASPSLQMASPLPLLLLALGVRPFLLLSVDRGAHQGSMRFAPLAASFVVEAGVRAGATLALVVLGAGPAGVAAAITLSFLATERTTRPGRSVATRATVQPTPQGRVFGTTGLLLVGQILINNGDVLIAKASLSPEDAGIYGTIALVGRAVYFLSWSIVSAVFPATARLEDPRERGALERRAFLALAALCAAMTAGAQLLGGYAAPIVFGDAFSDAGAHLGGYALATSLFALANLLATVDISQGRTTTSWVLLGGAALQTTLLLLAAPTAQGLVHAQLIAMASLLAGVVLVRVLESTWSGADRSTPALSFR